MDIPIHHEQCYPALAHCQQLPFPDGPHLVEAFITIPPIRAAKTNRARKLSRAGRSSSTASHCTRRLYIMDNHLPLSRLPLYMSVHAVAAGRFLSKRPCSRNTSGDTDTSAWYKIIHAISCWPLLQYVVMRVQEGRKNLLRDLMKCEREEGPGIQAKLSKHHSSGCNFIYVDECHTG